MAEPSTDDSGQDEVAQVFAEIDAGRLTLDAAILQHPALEARLREIASLQRLLKTAQSAPIPDAPRNLGEYKIVGVVGRGGMGIVYRAYHERLRREVAVKTIRPTHVSTHARERFQREQTALARLHQTHIVPIYAAGTDGAVEYFVMPYIEGASLHRVLEILRRGETGGRSKSDTLFSLVQSTGEDGGGRSTSSFVSLNGEPSTQGRSNRSGVLAKIETPAEPPSSLAYFRSAATIIASAAEALEHAHRRQVFHRDLKPNNIMLAADGRLWIIDFGLASFLPHESSEGKGSSDGDAELLTNAAVGTWSYMAPEQFEGKTDARTDVWGLGVTLYEMLTLRRAFAHRSSSEWKQAAAAEHPPHPATAAPAVPADLAAVCWKAMTKAPSDRYQSAGGLAEDLRRWLRDEPVRARKRGLIESTRRWVSKHRAWAVAIAIALVALPTIIGLQWWASIKAQAEIAEQRRQLVVSDLESILHSDRALDWSVNALKKIREAAAIRKDATLRDSALAAFAGPDAEIIARNLSGASSAAYDSAGKRLVLGGVEPRRNHPGSPAQIWNLDDEFTTPGKAAGAGLVAFQRDGTPVQLVGDKTGGLRLLHVLTGNVLREYVGPPIKPRGERPTTALSVEGDRVAASFPDEKETFVWVDARTVHRLPVGGTALSFSRDGSLLAIGSTSGETTIYSTADGIRRAGFTSTSHSVQALGFTWRATLRGDQPDGSIAIGSFGRYGVVDLATSRPTCFFEADEHVCKHLEFSPDGVTVFADNILFEAATGRRLLHFLGHMDVFAFSPSGAEVCQAAAAGFAKPEVVRLALKNNRGVSMLHGLRTPAARLGFSKDGRMLAALSRDWRIGIWKLERSEIVRMVDLDEGPFADNAAVALNDDGGRLAAASGTSASLWDTATGDRLRRWSLPPGFSNELAFTRAGELILVRTELKSQKDYPSSSHRFPGHPRTIRGRNLSSPTPEKPIYEIDDFAMHCYGIALTPDGERFIADGLTPTKPKGERSVVLFDGKTGREVRRFPLTHDYDYRSVRSDPTGETMTFIREMDPMRFLLIDSRDGRERQAIHANVLMLGPRGESWFAEPWDGGVHKQGVFRRDRDECLYHLDHFGATQDFRFSPDGRYFAFETSKGSVGVIDFPAMEKNLERLGFQ